MSDNNDERDIPLGRGLIANMEWQRNFGPRYYTDFTAPLTLLTLDIMLSPAPLVANLHSTQQINLALQLLHFRNLNA